MENEKFKALVFKKCKGREHTVKEFASKDEAKNYAIKNGLCFYYSDFALYDFGNPWCIVPKDTNDAI